MQAIDGLLLRALNPGIRKVVAMLRGLGFQTTSSGDGKTHECVCDLDRPFVTIRVSKPKRLARTAKRLATIIRDLGYELGEWTEDGEPLGIVIEASYFIEIDEAYIQLIGLDDAMLVAAPRGESWALAYAPTDWFAWLRAVDQLVESSYATSPTN
jgi:hypothetical protein